MYIVSLSERKRYLIVLGDCCQAGGGRRSNTLQLTNNATRHTCMNKEQKPPVWFTKEAQEEFRWLLAWKRRQDIMAAVVCVVILVATLIVLKKCCYHEMPRTQLYNQDIIMENIENKQRDGESCRGCGLPNYQGLCPHCRGDQRAFEDELVPPFPTSIPSEDTEI